MTTTNLGMTLPTVGASNDVWGDNLNADLQLIDDRLPKIAFSAYAASNQGITSNVLTKVVLGTEIFDIGSYFSSSRFTPLVAGYYQINGVIRGADAVAMTGFVVSLFKNGSEYKRGFYSGVINNSGAMTGTVTDIIHFNGTTDYVELYGLIIGSGPSFDNVSAAVGSSLSGAFVTT